MFEDIIKYWYIYDQIQNYIYDFSLILNSYEIILLDWILLSNKTLSGETNNLLTVELGLGSMSLSSAPCPSMRYYSDLPFVLSSWGQAVWVDI